MDEDRFGRLFTGGSGMIEPQYDHTVPRGLKGLERVLSMEAGDQVSDFVLPYDLSAPPDITELLGFRGPVVRCNGRLPTIEEFKSSSHEAYSVAILVRFLAEAVQYPDAPGKEMLRRLAEGAMGMRLHASQIMQMGYSIGGSYVTRHSQAVSRIRDRMPDEQLRYRANNRWPAKTELYSFKQGEGVMIVSIASGLIKLR